MWATHYSTVLISKSLSSYYYTNTTLTMLTYCHYCTKTRLFSTTMRQISSKTFNYRVVFLGSDNFSIPSLVMLTKLLNPGNLSVVVSNLNNIVGKYAQKNKLKTLLWDEYKRNNVEEEGEGDLGVVASFGYLIPRRVIQRFQLGILNVHGSLLPRWRGAAPIPHAIMAGDSKTGISIMQIAPHRFDIGPVLHRREIPLHPHIRRPELITILANVGAQALGHVLSDLDRFTSAPTFQNEDEAKMSPKLIPEVAEVAWDSKTALEIYNLFRGLYGVFKLKTVFNDKTVDLDDIGLVEMSSSEPSLDKNIVDNSQDILDIGTNFERFYSNSPICYLENLKLLPPFTLPGQIVFNKDILLVKCSEEGMSSYSQKYAPYVSVKKIKVGNKWMTAKDFQNGFLSKCKVDQRVFKSSQSRIVLEHVPLGIRGDKINRSNS